jgi:hypothetical protein
VTLRWLAGDGAETAAFQRVVHPPIQPRVEVVPPGGRILVSPGFEAALPVTIRNRASTDGHFTIAWNSDLGSGNRTVDVPAKGSETFTLSFPAKSSGSVPVNLDVRENGTSRFSGTTHVICSDGTVSLAAQSGVGVRVDSTFSGYSAGPLNDGVVETDGLAWNEGAWASDDSPSEHWVQLDFPAPQRVARVVIDWNVEGGITYSARSGRVVGTRPDGSEVTLAKISNASPTPKNTLHFQPVELKSLRLVQDAGGGAPERPGIMWLREIGVFQGP